MSTDIFHDYEDAYQPTLEELIADAIRDSEPEEVAELIAGCIYELDRAKKAFRDYSDDAAQLRVSLKRRIDWAKSHLTDIYAWDSDDPRANGWVDDRGRP